MSLKKYIPNSITSMNALCGSMGVVFALQGRPNFAFILMLAAACAAGGFGIFAATKRRRRR